MIKQSFKKDTITCNDKYCKKDKSGISIIYAYEDSDVFYQAKLLKYGRKCLCLTTEEPIAKGEKIYILTQDFPLEDTDLRIYEGCLAQVEECKKKNFETNPSYLIRGKSVNGMAISIGPNKLDVKVLQSGISYPSNAITIKQLWMKIKDNSP